MAHATVGSSVEADKQSKKNASENIVCTSMDNSVASAIAQPVPPDGGWGYVVVLASFLIHVIADGVTYSFGVFYLELLYYFEEGKGATAWIASILVGVTLCTGPISSTLVNKFGCRAVTIAGSILATASLLTSMWAQNIITLYFSIGLGTGLGFGLIYLPAIVSVTCYFEKYRSLATGVAVCGSGFGTLIFAPFVNYLIALYGWRGAMMICSGVVLNCTVLGALFRPLPTRKLKPTEKSSLNSKMNKRKYSNGLYNPEDNQKCVLQRVTFRRDTVACMKSLSQPVLISNSLMQQNSSEGIYKEQSNLPQKYSEETLHERQSSRSLPNNIEYVRTENKEVVVSIEREASILQKYVDITILKDPVFILFTVSNFLTSIGFYVPYVYVLPQAEERGINKKDASYLLAVIGISNTVGRIILGYISDKPWINRLLIYNLSLMICGIATIFSAFCSTFISFTIYTFVFGFTSGAYVGLTSVILVDLLGLHRLTNAFGQLLLFQGFASFIGPPIAGWLYDALKSYDPGFLAAGGMITVSGLILFFIPPVDVL